MWSWLWRYLGTLGAYSSTATNGFYSRSDSTLALENHSPNPLGMNPCQAKIQVDRATECSHPSGSIDHRCGPRLPKPVAIACKVNFPRAGHPTTNGSLPARSPMSVCSPFAGIRQGGRPRQYILVRSYVEAKDVCH